MSTASGSSLCLPLFVCGQSLKMSVARTWYTAFNYVDCMFEHLGRVNLAATLPVLEVVVELCSVVRYLNDLVTQEHYVLNVLL